MSDSRSAPGVEPALAELARLSVDGIAIVSAVGEVLFANPSAESLLGCGPGKALGFHLGIPASDAKGTDITLRRPDNQFATVEMRASEILWEGQSAYAVSLRDVSELRGALHELQRMASIVTSSDDAILSKKLDGTITSWNAGAERLYGYTEEEAIGQNVSMLVPDDMENDVPDVLERICKGKTVGHYETMRRTKAGDCLIISLTVSPINNYEGDVIGASSIARDVTEQKQIEDELREARAILQAAMDQSTAGIAIAEAPSGQLRYVNDAGLLIRGDDRGGIDGVDVDHYVESWKLFDLDGTPLETDQVPLARAVKYGETNSREFIIRRAEGDDRVVLARAAPILEDGMVIAAVVVFLDVTERHKAEESARRAGDLARSIVEHGPVGITILNPKGIIIDANQRAEDVLGLTRQTLKGKRSYNAPEWRISAVDGSDFPEEQLPFRRVIDTGAPVHNVEHAIEWANGDRRIVNINAAPLLNAEGELERVICTIDDITEFKRADEARRESEDRFRRTIINAPFPAMIHADDGEVVLINNVWSELTGYQLEDIPTTDHWAEKAYGEKKSDVRSIIENLYELDSKTEEGEFEICCRDGQKRLWSFASTPLGSDLKGRRLVLSMAMDLTEYKKLETQLHQSQKLEAIGQLAGGVAHDFNNLLMGIMGYTELCRDEVDSDHPIQEFLDEITRETERSANIVRQLLAFSRKQTITPRLLDLNDSVSGMLKMLQRLIGEDIDLMWQPGSDLRSVKMDPGQVDQILANLCVNARDAIGGVGKIIIETANITLSSDFCKTECHNDIKPGNCILLAVGDNGKGMDAQTRSRIFEPFFTTKGSGKGTGLGLATVYGIVKQNRGTIHVESELGEGTTFRIYLPCTEEKIEDSTSGVATEAVSTGNETILLVEDEKAILRPTCRFLEQLGYTVLAAETPARALELADSHSGKLDILVTDVIMPGMNGRELAEELTSRYSELKVLYMSGYTADVIAHRGILEEGIQFLSKPVSRKQLASKLRTILDE